MVSALLYSRLLSAARMVSGVVLRDKPGASVNARSSVRVSAAGEQASASGGSIWGESEGKDKNVT